MRLSMPTTRDLSSSFMASSLLARPSGGGTNQTPDLVRRQGEFRRGDRQVTVSSRFATLRETRESAAMLTVHHLGRSQSERVVWLCEELELPYELKRYDREPSGAAPPEYKAL